MSCSWCGETTDVRRVEWRGTFAVFLCGVCILSGIVHRAEGRPLHPETPHETTRPVQTYNANLGVGASTPTFASEVSGDSIGWQVGD